MLVTLAISVLVTVPFAGVFEADTVESTMEDRCYIDDLHEQDLALYRADHSIHHCKGRDYLTRASNRHKRSTQKNSKRLPTSGHEQ